MHLVFVMHHPSQLQEEKEQRDDDPGAHLIQDSAGRTLRSKGERKNNTGSTPSWMRLSAYNYNILEQIYKTTASSLQEKATQGKEKSLVWYRLLDHVLLVATWTFEEALRQETIRWLALAPSCPVVLLSPYIHPFFFLEGVKEGKKTEATLLFLSILSPFNQWAEFMVNECEHYYCLPRPERTTGTKKEEG
jgi:hypothetical protein